jgi:hypothetical protein
MRETFQKRHYTGTQFIGQSVRALGKVNLLGDFDQRGEKALGFGFRQRNLREKLKKKVTIQHALRRHRIQGGEVPGALPDSFHQRLFMMGTGTPNERPVNIKQN